MHQMCMQTFNTCHALHGKTKDLEDLGKSSTWYKIWAKLSIEQFSIWLKYYYHVNFLFFGSHSAHFLPFGLDSAPTESLGSKPPFRLIIRPA